MKELICHLSPKCEEQIHRKCLINFFVKGNADNLDSDNFVYMTESVGM